MKSRARTFGPASLATIKPMAQGCDRPAGGSGIVRPASYRRMQLQDVWTAEDCLYVMAIIDLFSHGVMAGRWVQR